MMINEVIMKRIMLFIACMALLGLCNAQRGYRITGNLGQLQQDTFYLVVPNLNGTVNVLGVSILKEGNLEFAGQVPEPVMATIMTSDRQGMIPLMLENTDYSVQIGTESIEVKGGVEQAVFNQFNTLQREAKKQQQKLQSDMKTAYEDANQMRVQALSGQAQKFMQNMQKRQTEIVKENANTSTAAYIVLTCVTGAGLNPIVAIIIATIACTIFGVVIEGVAYRPLRNAASPLAVLITAIGVSYLLQNLALLIFGSNTKSFPEVIKLPNLKLAGGKLTITGTTILTIVLCIVIMAGLMLFINKTKAGQAMLAVSEDKGAAQLMGINVNKTISMTFAIGSALAAIAGVLLCSAYPSLTPYTGSMPGIKAFVAAVFGGIGSVPGALIGGIILGIIEILGKAYISSQLADAIVFAVLIVVLLVKPTGILGKNIQEKV